MNRRFLLAGIAIASACMAQSALGATVEEIKAFIREHVDVSEEALGVFNSLASELVNVKQVAYLSGHVIPHLSSHPQGRVALFQALPTLSMDYDHWAGEFRVNDGRRWEIGEVHAFALISKKVWDEVSPRGRFKFTGSTKDFDGDYEMGHLNVQGTAHKAWVFATHQGLNRTASRRQIEFTVCRVSLSDCQYGD